MNFEIIRIFARGLGFLISIDIMLFIYYVAVKEWGQKHV